MPNPQLLRLPPWRRRGVRYSSCGTLTFIFPLHFPRRYTPACAKPPVVRSAFESVVHYFFGRHYFFEHLSLSNALSDFTPFSGFFPCAIHFRITLHFRAVIFVRCVFGLYFTFYTATLHTEFSGYTALSERNTFSTTLTGCNYIFGIVLDTHYFFGLHCIFEVYFLFGIVFLSLRTKFSGCIIFSVGFFLHYSFKT